MRYLTLGAGMKGVFHKGLNNSVGSWIPYGRTTSPSSNAGLWADRPEEGSSQLISVNSSNEGEGADRVTMNVDRVSVTS